MKLKEVEGPKKSYYHQAEYSPGTVLLHIPSGQLYLIMKDDMAVSLVNFHPVSRSSMDPLARWVKVEAELHWSKPCQP